MKYLFTISRILLGLIFVVFGLNGFLHFIPTTQFPGVAGQFTEAIFTSHFYVVVFGTQVVGGLLVLANRYVPLGLLILGPVLVNILSFHIFMAPKAIPLALVATALWFVVFFRVRSAFSGVFVQRSSNGSSSAPEEVVRSSWGRDRAA
jgi:putative oxidoreductase